MKKAYFSIPLLALVGLGVLLPAALPAEAAMNTWIKGASITPSYPTEFDTATFSQSLENLKATNANSVSFVIPLSQTNTQSTDIGPAANTPTDESLVHAITQAHALGLSVTLKPHLDPKSGEWRASIDPADRAAWFEAYDAQILHYAQIAQANHVEMIIVGTELIDMSTDDHNPTNTANWRSLISQVRAVYSGKLTYAANWGTGAADEKNHIAFWDALDYAGVDAYYPVGTSTSGTSIAALLDSWNTWNSTDFTPFAQKVGKPVIFTEVGYKSTTDAHLNPGDYSVNNAYDPTEQANDYSALFSFWSTNPYVAGMSFWEWKPEADAGGTGNTDYTPQNKPAQSVITSWYGGTGVPYVAPAISVVASTQTITATVSQPLTVTAHVTNSGGSVSGGVIDLEIYNSAGTKLYQTFAQNQTFGSSMVPYSVTWTPPSAGTYTVKAGAFSGDWSTQYSWNNSAETITAGAAAPVAPAAFTVTVPPLTAILAQSLPITALVTDTGGATSALVDIEVYASNGQKVFQNFLDNQTFTAGQSKPFTMNWTPAVRDTYTVAVGVFTPGWTNNYVWINNAQTISFAQPAIPTGLTATALSSSSVAISWTTTPSATGYTLYRNGSMLSKINASSYTDASVAPSSTYQYAVSASYSSGSDSAQSAQVAVTTPAAPVVQAPPAPVAPPVVTTPPAATSTPTIPMPTPTTGKIDVWWPTTSSSIGGTLPFKALVENLSVDTYDMFWQVDGGTLNSMYSSSQDYPHKETYVDVSGWNWKGTGPYLLTFTAKTKSGSVITTASLPVTISS